MVLLRILGVGIVAAVLSLLVKQHRPELAIGIPITGGVIIFLMIIPSLQDMVELFGSLAEQAGMQNQYLKLILKMIGIAYLCQFAAELCRDAGESALAGALEMTGAVCALLAALPLLQAVLNLLLEFMA